MSARVVIISPSSKNDLKLDVEVFNTPRSRHLGMRNRETWTKPVLFVMPYDGPWNFTMRDTLLPMDIVFVSRILPDAGAITEVQYGVPGDPGPYSGVCKWALELPAGTC